MRSVRNGTVWLAGLAGVGVFHPRHALAMDVEAVALSLTTFFVGFAVAFFLYLLFRPTFERWAERFARRRRFLYQSYHHDSISEKIYGYYFWDREDGFEWMSPKLRELLRIDDSHTTFESFRKALSDKDYQALEMAAAEFKREEIKEFHRILKITRADVYLECIGVLRRGDHEKHGFTFWFRDLSQQMKDYRALMGENQNLRQRNRQWQEICDRAPFPIWVRAENLDITYCNACFAEIVEEGGQSALDGKTLELNAQVRELAEKAKSSHQQQERECHVITHGKRRLFHVIERPVPKPWDDQVAFIGYGFDVHAKEEAEAELRRYVSAQSEFLESSASAMAIYGPDMRLKNHNQAFVRLWKMDEAWLDEGPAYGDILENLREKRLLPEQANFLQFKKENIGLFTTLIRSHEEYYYLPDGRVLRVIIIPHALGGLLFAYEDVTDRLALERNYNTLIAVQRASLDHLHEGVAVFGENGRLRLHNPAFTRMWALDEKMLATEPHVADLMEKVKPLLHREGDWAEQRDKAISQVVGRKNLGGRLHLANGKVVDWHSVPLPDGAVMMAYYDVTDSILVEETLREKNKALEEADKVKTEFLASMSYELRSPLTSIMGFSEALAKHYFGALNDKQQEYVDAINQSSHKLMGLINNILDLASIEAGYLKLHVTHFPVRALLEEIRDMQKERLKEAGVKLRLNCAKEVGDMRADEVRVKQIIFNLLHNAIKFSDAGGTITIAITRLEDGGLRLSVADEGEGMSQEEQAMVFERFYKGSSIKARKSGAGLGLSMVKRFTELHGGVVELTSRPGEGTTVTCTFPQKREDRVLAASAEKEPQATAF